MGDSIGKTLAEELKKRAGVQAKLQEEAQRKSTQQKASDDAALTSLVKRIGAEVENFNENADDLPRLYLSGVGAGGHYTLTSIRTIVFRIHASRLDITIAPSTSPVLSTVIDDGKGFRYRHIGPNGMATNRESTENEIVDGLLKQACGL